MTFPLVSAKHRLARVIHGMVGASSLFAIAASAQTVADPDAVRFGVRPDVISISLSPSGGKIAFVSAGPEHSEVVNVIDLANPSDVKQVLTNTEKIADIDWCEWTSDTRLLCQIAGIK